MLSSINILPYWNNPSMTTESPVQIRLDSSKPNGELIFNRKVEAQIYCYERWQEHCTIVAQSCLAQVSLASSSQIWPLFCCCCWHLALMCSGHVPSVTWGFWLPYFPSASKAFQPVSRRVLSSSLHWLLSLSSVEMRKGRHMWKFTLSLAHHSGQTQLAPALPWESSRCSQILHKACLCDTFPTTLR